jgi:hypothetical protein
MDSVTDMRMPGMSHIARMPVGVVSVPTMQKPESRLRCNAKRPDQ